MARHGENIRKRKDGRWEGRFLIYNKEKEKKVYHSIYGKSYDEVRRKMNTQRELFENGLCETKSRAVLENIKFSDIAQEWLGDIKRMRKPSTFAKYNAVYHSHIEPYMEEKKLSTITDTFVTEQIFDHLSDSTCKSIFIVLNQILKYATKRYAVIIPALKIPTFHIRKKSINVLTHSEQKSLITALYQEIDQFKMAVLICMLLGLRLGELCALKWLDIDFENRILMVKRTVQRLPVEGQKTKTALVETMPKSECSRREIPLSDTVLALLQGFQNGKEYVFGGDKPLEPRTMQYHFKKLLRDAELTDKNFHILRHTFATNCIEGGMDVKSLSEILGHSDVQITLRLYVHPTMDTKRQGMNQIAQFYDQIRGQIQGHIG